MAQLPLLMEELTPIEALSLAGLKQYPGYLVLEKLMMAACKRATDDAIRVNPAEEGYTRKLVALQGRARERSEFCLLILESIDWHEMRVAQTKDPEVNTEPESNPILKGLQQ
jgi:hypothetical protein